MIADPSSDSVKTPFGVIPIPYFSLIFFGLGFVLGLILGS